MKKILSIITALSLAMMTMLSAVTVSAAEKITADEVKELIYSTGLSAYPELWDKIITEQGIEEDVLNPETRTVRDIVDVNQSCRTYYLYNSADTVFDNSQQVIWQFKGYNSDGNLVDINYRPEDYIIPELKDTVLYQLIPGNDDEDLSSEDIYLIRDYDRIAEIINQNDITAADIRIVTFGGISGSCVYVKDNSGTEYAIPSISYVDNVHAPYLGKDVKSIEEGVLMPFGEWCEDVIEFENNMVADTRTFTDIVSGEATQYEEIEGDEIRDTDTRAAYIGTESKFVDVSGDLVSYVNELNDLGIINGYDDNLFMPENNITRAEAAAMIARMLKYNGEYSGEFQDVSADDWFADDVAALTAAGIINGYDENRFSPYAGIKYQEVMKILVFALGYATKYDTVLDNFYPSMTNQKAMEIGLINGLASFDTTARITRGDMAIMLSNALDTHMFTEVKVISSDGMTGGGIFQEDITLIDYLNGGKLNGTIPKAYFD